LRYGQSITDGCIDWDTSVAVMERLAQAVRLRRTHTPGHGTERRPAQLAAG